MLHFERFFWPRFTKYRISYLILTQNSTGKCLQRFKHSYHHVAFEQNAGLNAGLTHFWIGLIHHLFIYLFYILEATSMFFTILDSGSKALIYIFFFFVCVCVAFACNAILYIFASSEEKLSLLLVQLIKQLHGILATQESLALPSRSNNDVVESENYE